MEMGNVSKRQQPDQRVENRPIYNTADITSGAYMTAISGASEFTSGFGKIRNAKPLVFCFVIYRLLFVR